MLKVLNLYAGLGGNRKSWTNVKVTAVEMDAEIATAYHENFPQDTVVIADAHDYLLAHYNEFDFIWSSPPCPTHSRIRHIGTKKGNYGVVYPDMQLYQEIIFLKHNFKGKFVVENVIPYYTPLIKPTAMRERHCFWANFNIQSKESVNTADQPIEEVMSNSDRFGFSIVGKKFTKRKDQILRNLVNPAIGLFIFNSAFKDVQHSLTTTEETEVSGAKALRAPPTTEVVGIRAGDILLSNL